MFRTSTIVVLLATTPALADTNVDTLHQYAWGENIGWTNWADANSGSDGVELSPDAEFLSGFVWAENVGWINLGSGAGPYANLVGTSHGVNLLPSAYLDGYAWGENIGWINFSTQPSIGVQGARYDATDNRLRGFAWAENVGWINLDDDTYFIGFTNPCPADLNGSGSVEAGDLAVLLASWGGAGGPADLDSSGNVDAGDLAILLAAWGPCV